MPLLVLTQQVPQPPDPTPRDPVLVIPRYEVGRPYAVWIDPDGQQWPLTGPDREFGWFTTPGVAGWGAVPITIVTDPHARGGEVVRHVRANPRRLTWPLHIHGDTHMEWLARYRALMRAFTMTTTRRKPGILRVIRPDGSAREIEAWYEDGFRGEPGENWVFANPVLTLYCPDGYWRDTEPTEVTRQFSTGVPYLSDYPTVSSGQVLGDTTIINPGDTDAWPVWTITGPAAAVTATNNTTGQMFSLSYSLAAGKTITITTDRPTIRGPSGQNLVNTLDWPQSELWPLVSGPNSITFEVAGASTGTQATLRFYPRYETA